MWLKRERLSSRLGFILLSAGCAIGLGNVWRFPYITGQYGGAAFVLIYLFFLVIFGLPIMVMEFSVGRASQRSVATSFRELEPKGTKWHIFSYFAMAGNYVLMMMYTTISGWMLRYLYLSANGSFAGLSAGQVKNTFEAVKGDAGQSILWMALATVLGFGICIIGLQRGVERITKWMMAALILVMVALAANSLFLPGALEGVKFYLLPNFQKMAEQGIGNAIYAAMGQAFFTLSLGIGSMSIFGSYIGKERSLTGEALRVTALDTFVALMAGLIIFPACSAFGVAADSGPGLIFITLPNVFNSMPGGRLWGSLFFLFMSFAALTTLVAVFENIVSFGIDLFSWSRKKSVLISCAAILVLSLPCALGSSALAGFQPFGPGSAVLDLEDFIVSNNFLPLGSMVFLLFCTTRKGWGFRAFLEEADGGLGMKFPRWSRIYVSYILPLVVVFVFIMGYFDKFFAK